MFLSSPTVGSLWFLVSCFIQLLSGIRSTLFSFFFFSFFLSFFILFLDSGEVSLVPLFLI